jgi:hypothetical protein
LNPHRLQGINILTAMALDLENNCGLSLTDQLNWLEYLEIRRCAKQGVTEEDEDGAHWSAEQEIEQQCDEALDCDPRDVLYEQFNAIADIGREFDPGFDQPIVNQEIP